MTELAKESYFGQQQWEMPTPMTAMTPTTSLNPHGRDLEQVNYLLNEALIAIEHANLGQAMQNVEDARNLVYGMLK